MAHPKHGYFQPDGTRALGTTTVIGRFKDSGPLLWWACQQGQAHPKDDTRTALYGYRDEMGATGTAVHFLVRRKVHGLQPLDLNKLEVLEMGEDGRLELDDDRRQALQVGYDAYVMWERMTKLKITHQEIRLVSPEYGFGGTPDALGLIQKEPVLIDWKTSKGVYPDFLIQLAAYGHLCEHGMLMDKGFKTLGIKVKGFHLCRFSKEHGDFSHHYYPELDVAWEQFKLFVQAYRYDKLIAARAK